VSWLVPATWSRVGANLCGRLWILVQGGRAETAPRTRGWNINVRPKHGRSAASSMLRSRCSPAVVVTVPPRLHNGLVFALMRSLLNGYE
jgi:hypothetical protein